MSKAITDWVKRGGVLVLLGNDAQNAELDRFNTLAGAFGIRFNKDRKFEVVNNDYKMGGIDIAPGSEIFTTARKIFVKEIASLSLTGKARSVLTARGDNVMAVARHGKERFSCLATRGSITSMSMAAACRPNSRISRPPRDLSRWLIARAKGK